MRTSPEQSGFENNAWGSAPNTAPYAGWGAQPESRRTKVASRFNEILSNPETQARAREIVHNVGGSALKGALESSGVGTLDTNGQLQIDKRGVAKAAFNPKYAAGKGAVGALKGAKTAARQEAMGLKHEAIGMAQQRAHNAFNNHAASVADQPYQGPGRGNTEAQPVAGSWDTAPAQPANNWNNDSWSTTPNAADASSWDAAPAPQQPDYNFENTPKVSKLGALKAAASAKLGARKARKDATNAYTFIEQPVVDDWGRPLDTAPAQPAANWNEDNWSTTPNAADASSWDAQPQQPGYSAYTHPGAAEPNAAWPAVPVQQPKPRFDTSEW